MDFTPKSKRRRTVKPDIDESSRIYTHDLQLYKTVPNGSLTLEEFQTIAVERLKVLQLVESVGSQCLSSIEECKNALEKALKKENYRHYIELLRGTGSSQSTDEEKQKLIIEARKRDHISHFILRLAYGQNMDLKAWFLRNELDLFKWRFTSLNAKGTSDMMQIYDFDYKPILIEEKKEFHDHLRSSSYKELDVDKTDIYKVPFEDVLDLISERKVFVRRGVVFLPQTELVSLFTTLFKDNLTQELLNVPQYIAQIGQDDRLLSFLKALPNCFSGMSKVIWNDETTPIAMIEDLSKSSFPLCMRVMHEALKTDHHLKNGGRLAYGMFLKGIGVTLEDALTFWKDEFLKGKAADRWDKEHKYTIRHYFGKEGKKTNYTPYGCNKLITQHIGQGDYHGCPYKYMDSNALKTRLTHYNLPESNVDKIVEFAKKGEYLHACRTYFETTHKRPTEKIVFHPNHYFLESRSIHNESAESSSDSKATQGTQNTLSTSNSQNSQLYSQTEAQNSVKPKVEPSPASKKVVKKDNKVNIEELLNENNLDWSDIE